MSSLLCLDLFSILSASTLYSTMTFMLTIISKWKWSSTLKVTVNVGARVRAEVNHTYVRTLARTCTSTTRGRRIADTHTHTHTHIHNYSDFLGVQWSGVIADLFRRADVPGGTYPLAYLFRPELPRGRAKVPARVNVLPAHLPSV